MGSNPIVSTEFSLILTTSRTSQRFRGRNFLEYSKHLPEIGQFISAEADIDRWIGGSLGKTFSRNLTGEEDPKIAMKIDFFQSLKGTSQPHLGWSSVAGK
ncbi:MAG: hypothetical protein HY645_09815 [Acidobacteria bacterium]|nr:hypothetical protein [Acidobacteriota bacterium]